MRGATRGARADYYRSGRRCAVLEVDAGLLHVYGWRRDGGPFFLDNPQTLEDGGPESAD
jgi:hypothetical protein